MRLRATVKIRNDAMISAREKLGWSQTTLGKKANVPLTRVVNLERLDYTHSPENLEEYATRISATLGIPVDSILPLDLIGKSMLSDIQQIREVNVCMLFDSQQNRLLLKSPDTEVEKQDDLDIITDAIGGLVSRTQTMIKLYFGQEDGEEHTFEEIANTFNVSKERCRQIILSGIRKVRQATGKQFGV